MKVLLFGGSGQLGQSIQKTQLGSRSLVVTPRSLDLRDGANIEQYVRAQQPDVVINAAAMTDVDGAHLEPDQAFLTNALGPAAIARACESVGARFLQVSTEAVFDGRQTTRYHEIDSCQPVSVYGASKLAGEHLARVYCSRTFVIRTSWLYSMDATMNFPTRLMRQLQDPTAVVRVVTDIVGNPTPASLLAEALLRIVDSQIPAGTYHVCCTGAASKYDWAKQIMISMGIDLNRLQMTTSNHYSTIAERPQHVDLDTSRFARLGLLELPDWRVAWEQAWVGQ